MSERIWLVDEHDEPVGEGWQERVYPVNWKNFRTVCGFIRNRQGLLWIPFRSYEKTIFPACFDASVMGSVKYGETYRDAFKDEALDEVGIDVDTVELRHLGHLSPFTHELSSWYQAWEIRAESVSSYNRKDYATGYWMTASELRVRIANGEKAKPDLETLINLFYPDVVSVRAPAA